MTPHVMRQLWSVVENSQSKTLLQLDDASLVQWLVKQTLNQGLLDNQQADCLSDYIKSRIELIREMAYERQYC
jgi:hypothetical protein